MVLSRSGGPAGIGFSRRPVAAWRDQDRTGPVALERAAAGLAGCRNLDVVDAVDLRHRQRRDVGPLLEPRLVLRYVRLGQGLQARRDKMRIRCRRAQAHDGR